jgi:hypothetical protein
MKLPEKVRAGWEHRFPDLGEKWTHWKIMGDGYLLAVVDGRDLSATWEVVNDNYGRFSSIKASRANVDEVGQLIAEEKSLFEISRFQYDERIRKSIETDT